MAHTAPPLSAPPAQAQVVEPQVYHPLTTHLNKWALGSTLLPWGGEEPPVVSLAFPSTIVNGRDPGQWLHPLKPKLYYTHMPSSIILGACPSEVLDLSLSLAVRFARVLVAAHVPAAYVTDAHLGRVAWLYHLSAAGRLHVLRSVTGHLWVLIACTPGVFARVFHGTPPSSYLPW
jgi:hypothetical protein